MAVCRDTRNQEGKQSQRVGVGGGVAPDTEGEGRNLQAGASPGPAPPPRCLTPPRCCSLSPPPASLLGWLQALPSEGAPSRDRRLL